MLFQRELAEKIVAGVKEIDFAIERHQRMLQEEKEKVQNIYDSKLKPKGHLLLKNEKN